MKEHGREARGPRAVERQSSSFLVRVWTEPREKRGKERPLRLYVRNLQTGEERYLSEPQELVDSLIESFFGEKNQAEGTSGG